MAAYLKLTDIEGGCTRENFAGQIELTGISFGGHSSGSAPGARARTRCSLDAFTLTKKADRSSPTLLKHMVGNQVIGEGTVTFTKSAGDGEEVEFIKYELKNVYITNWNTTAQSTQGRDVTPDETVSLSFDEITSIYVGQENDSTASGNVEYTWMITSGV